MSETDHKQPNRIGSNRILRKPPIIGMKASCGLSSIEPKPEQVVNTTESECDAIALVEPGVGRRGAASVRLIDHLVVCCHRTTTMQALTR